MTYPHGGSVKYDRDVLSRVTDVRVKTSASATELVTHYVYDANGNLSALTDPLGGVTSYVYDAVDRLTTKTLPNGVVTTYGYDARDRVLSVVHTGLMSNVLASVTYVRSPSGEPTRVTREDGSYVVLTYDAALRLDTETYYNSADQVLDAIDYGYDLDGNRTSKVSLVGGAEAYDYDAGFKLASVTHGSETDVYTHDGGGRLIGVDRDGVDRDLEYNVDDKLTRVVDDGIEVAAYQFDGAGRRVGSVIGGVSKRYLVAPNVGDGYETPQAITDDDGDLIAAYVFAGEHPIARITPTGIEYYLQDSMGSVIAAANASGASTASIKYDSFGDVVSASGTAATSSAVGGDFRLHGMWLDSATNLYHVRARTYDASTGRFLSRDPVQISLRSPETVGRYDFTSGNPHRMRDPLGEFGLVELSVVTAVSFILATTAMPSFAYAQDDARSRLIPFEVIPDAQNIVVQKGGSAEMLDHVFRRMLYRVFRDLHNRGYQPVVRWGFRTQEQQAEKIAEGVSPVGSDDPASDNSSFHLIGRAADVIDSRWGWEIPEGEPFWDTLGEIANSYGLEWGGDWKKHDWAHVQCVNRTGNCI